MVKHKKCSVIKGPLRPDPEFRCARCLEKTRPFDGRTMWEVKINDEMLKAVPEFCYLGDMLSARDGCDIVARWLRDFMRKFLPTAAASPLSQSAGSDRRIDVFSMREKCYDVCSRDLGSGYDKPSSA